MPDVSPDFQDLAVQHRQDVNWGYHGIPGFLLCHHFPKSSEEEGGVVDGGWWGADGGVMAMLFVPGECSVLQLCGLHPPCVHAKRAGEVGRGGSRRRRNMDKLRGTNWMTLKQAQPERRTI